MLFFSFSFPVGVPSSFCHEHASIGIFDLLIHENDLLPIFSSCGLGLDDVHFIKELILGRCVCVCARMFVGGRACWCGSGCVNVCGAENNTKIHGYTHTLIITCTYIHACVRTGDAHEAPEGFAWKGRGEKTFLYDIVANKRNGVDVDRFDYFRR
jgi:hypothetical protein